jgi:nucleotide-binding universal stress UspA family protein
MFSTVIVPLDGSGLAEQAVPLAIDLARGCGARLLLVRVHEPPPAAMAHVLEWDREVRTRETAYLETVAIRARPLVDTNTELLVHGRPGEAICGVVQRCASPLVVMSSHGATGIERYLIGSVADAVVRGAYAPILVVRARTDGRSTTRPIHKILIALDGSLSAEGVLPFAGDLAVAAGARLELTEIVANDSVDGAGDVARARRNLHHVARRLERTHPSLAVRVMVARARRPGVGIAFVARKSGCDAVALTRRSDGLSRFFRGSVVDEVMRIGPPLMLFVPPRGGVASAPVTTKHLAAPHRWRRRSQGA